YKEQLAYQGDASITEVAYLPASHGDVHVWADGRAGSAVRQHDVHALSDGNAYEGGYDDEQVTQRLSHECLLEGLRGPRLEGAARGPHASRLGATSEALTQASFRERSSRCLASAGAWRE